MKRKEMLHNPTWIIPILMFVTNIGNGMYTLAVSYVMYELTGSTAAFAGILVFESAFSVITQLFASVVVDDGRAKQCACFSDIIRGISVIIAGLIVGNGYPFAIYIGVIAINLVRPFYRTAMFAIGPLVAQREGLARYSARNSVAQQAGQLIGAGIAGSVISVFGSSMCIVINGITFLIAAFFMAWITIPGQHLLVREDKTHSSLLKLANPITLLTEWLALFKQLFLNLRVFLLILVCTVDYIVVSYINMAYAPTLAQLGSEDLWMSIWDSLFAIGAIVGAIVFSRCPKCRSNDIKISVYMFAEAILCLCFTLAKQELVAVGMFGLGLTNAISVSCYSYELQMSSKGKFHGRIAGLRQFAISIMSMLIVPLLSRGFTAGVTNAALVIMVTCLVGALIMALLISHIKPKEAQEAT